MKMSTYFLQIHGQVELRWELHLPHELLVFVLKFDVLVDLGASKESCAHCFVKLKY